MAIIFWSRFLFKINILGSQKNGTCNCHVLSVPQTQSTHSNSFHSFRNHSKFSLNHEVIFQILQKFSFITRKKTWQCLHENSRTVITIASQLSVEKEVSYLLKYHLHWELQATLDDPYQLWVQPHNICYGFLFGHINLWRSYMLNFKINI